MSSSIDISELQSIAFWSGDGPEDSTYRYYLQHVFPFEEQTIAPPRFALFIMMNPSYASENQWDNTVRRCAGYAKDWGYDGLRIANIFAFRTPFPKGGTDKHGTEWDPIWEQEDPIGPLNDSHIRSAVSLPTTKEVVCAWGNAGQRLSRGEDVLEIVAEEEMTPKALRVNKSGQPAHPLYLPKDLKPKPITEFESFRAIDLTPTARQLLAA